MRTPTYLHPGICHLFPYGVPAKALQGVSVHPCPHSPETPTKLQRMPRAFRTPCQIMNLLYTYPHTC